MLVPFAEPTLPSQIASAPSTAPKTPTPIALIIAPTLSNATSAPAALDEEPVEDEPDADPDPEAEPEPEVAEDPEDPVALPDADPLTARVG